jgi:hypothetical protein
LVVILERLSDDFLQVLHPPGRPAALPIVEEGPATADGLPPEQVDGPLQPGIEELGRQVQRLGHGRILPPFWPKRVLIRLHQDSAAGGI